MVHNQVIFCFQFSINYELIQSYLDSFTTTTAPWNVTQWVDPFDPHPKVASIPIIIVVRRR